MSDAIEPVATPTKKGAAAKTVEYQMVNTGNGSRFVRVNGEDFSIPPFTAITISSELAGHPDMVSLVEQGLVSVQSKES